MPIPLDLFVTPYQGPGQLPSSATGFNGLADFGSELRDNALKKQQLSQDMAKHGASLAVEHESVKGRNAYYQDSVDARREATQERGNANREKRVGFLMDAFRKAKGTQERDLIRQELTRLGYSVDESESEFQAPVQAEGAGAILPEAAAPPAKAGPGVPKPNKKFMSALDQFMNTENGKEPGAPAEDPGASPMPWEALGMPAAPKPKGKGGRFSIRDREGNLVQTFDEPAEKEKSRGAIEAAIAPYIDDPRNPEQQAAAKRASEVAERAISAGFSDKEALQLGINQLNKEMGSFKAQKLPSSAPAPAKGGAAAGGSGLGVGRQEQSRLGALSDDTQTFLFKLSSDQKIPDARKALAETAEMESALEKAGQDGFSGGAALSRYMKSISGAAVSEREVDRIMGGAGALSQWETKLNRYTNGGKLDDDLIRGLKNITSRARQVFNERIQNAVQTGQGYFRNNVGLATPEDRAKQEELVSGFFTGKWSDQKPPSGPKGGAPSGPKMSLEEKMKARGL
jgi:hypothetical protein